MAVLLLSRLLALLPAAADYPKPVDDHVNDFAGVLTEAQAGKVREIARSVRSEKGIPVVVVTLDSLADWNAAGWSIERYATNLYNEWGIGSPETNQGVLFLVVVGDRKLRIAVGQGFGSTFDEPARGILDREVVPRFRAGDLAEGILAGVEGIAAALRAGPAREPAHGGEGDSWTPRGTGIGAPLRRSPSSGFPIGWIVLGVLGILAVGALSSILRGVRGGWGPGRAGMGGWGGLMMGGLGGFLGSALYNSIRGHRSGSGSSWSSGGSWGGPSSWGGGTSSFGGGFSAGGGASGSW
jgi:uncharacterized protein